MDTILGLIMFAIWIYFIVIYFMNKKNGLDITVGIIAILLFVITIIGFNEQSYEYKQKLYICQHKDMKTNFNLFNN